MKDLQLIYGSIGYMETDHALKVKIHGERDPHDDPNSHYTFFNIGPDQWPYLRPNTTIYAALKDNIIVQSVTKETFINEITKFMNQYDLPYSDNNVAKIANEVLCVCKFKNPIKILNPDLDNITDLEPEPVYSPLMRHELINAYRKTATIIKQESMTLSEYKRAINTLHILNILNKLIQMFNNNLDSYFDNCTGLKELLTDPEQSIDYDVLYQSITKANIKNIDYIDKNQILTILHELTSYY